MLLTMSYTPLIRPIFRLPTTIPIPNIGGGGTGYIAITPDGTKAYFLNNGQINILSIPSYAITGTIVPPGSLTSPLGIAFTPDGATAYVAYLAGGGGNFGGVITINVQNSTFSGTVSDSSGTFLSPSFIAITPAIITPTKVYVTNRQAGHPVSVVEGDAVIAQVSGGTINTCNGIAITPNGLTAYVVNGSMVNTIEVTSNVVHRYGEWRYVCYPLFYSDYPQWHHRVCD